MENSHYHNLKWPFLQITLNSCISEFAANETLGIKHGIGRVRCHLFQANIYNKQPLDNKQQQNFNAPQPQANSKPGHWQ